WLPSWLHQGWGRGNWRMSVPTPASRWLRIERWIFNQTRESKGDTAMHKIPVAWITILEIGLVLCFAKPVRSQTATASLRGTVSDNSGAVIPGAQAVLSNPSTGYSRSAMTDSQGAYEFVEIPPATYDLTVTASGFAKYTQKGIVLVVATPTTLNVSLGLASVS